MTIATIFNWSIAWQYRGQLLSGLATAVEVAAVALAISVVVGIVLALGRMSKPPVSWLATLWVNVFRGIPALVSVLWVYFGWSLLLGINLTVFEAGVVALVLLYGAFIAEIYRSALEAVPKGQREAGLAVGMHRSRVFLHVILPQATKIAVPNIGSMFIGMVKDTSVFSVIGLLEVIRVTMNIESMTYQPFVLYTVAAGRLRRRRLHDRLSLPPHRAHAGQAGDGKAVPDSDRPQAPAPRAHCRRDGGGRVTSAAPVLR